MSGTEDVSRAKAKCVCGHDLHEGERCRNSVSILPMRQCDCDFSRPAPTLDDLMKQQICPSCEGKGTEADYVGLEMRCVEVECSRCKGKGTVTKPKEAEGGGVGQPLKCLNCDKLHSDHWERNDGFYCHTDGEELFRSEWKPKEAAPEAALDEIGRECIVTRDTYRLLTETSEDFADRMRRTLIAERRQRLPEPATEGAPETTREPHNCSRCGRLCKCLLSENHCWHECDPCDCGHDIDEHENADSYGHEPCSKCPCDKYQAAELKAEGAEKAPKRPEWHTITEDGDSENVYPEDAATAYMDALESRNAELSEQLKISKETYDLNLRTLAHNHEIDRRDWQRDLLAQIELKKQAEREVKRLKDSNESAVQKEGPFCPKCGIREPKHLPECPTWGHVPPIEVSAQKERPEALVSDVDMQALDCYLAQFTTETAKQAQRAVKELQAWRKWGKG